MFLNNSCVAYSSREGFCQVKFLPNGGTVTTNEMLVFYEGTIPKPEDPVKENATFLGWYADKDLTQEWNFETDIVNDKTQENWNVKDLYAKWSN